MAEEFQKFIEDNKVLANQYNEILKESMNRVNPQLTEAPLDQIFAYLGERLQTPETNQHSSESAQIIEEKLKDNSDFQNLPFKRLLADKLIPKIIQELLHQDLSIQEFLKLLNSQIPETFETAANSELNITPKLPYGLKPFNPANFEFEETETPKTEKTIVKSESSEEYHTGMEGLPTFQYFKTPNVHSTKLYSAPIKQEFHSSYRTNSELKKIRPLSIQEILNCVPSWDGNLENLKKFITGCETAARFTPQEHQNEITNLITNKLSGSARFACLNVNFKSIHELISFFEERYGNPKDYLSLLNELGTIRQFPAERVIEYSGRILELSTNIYKAAKREGRDYNGAL